MSTRLMTTVTAAAAGTLAAGALLAATSGGGGAVVPQAQAQAGFTVSAGQLQINQRISQAAVRRSNRSLNYLAPIRTAQTDAADDGRQGVRPLGQIAGSGQGWTTGQIANGAITEPKVGDGAVTTAKVGDGAVTGPKLADGAVGTAKISPGTHGVALAGVKVVGDTVASWFNRFGGEPTVETTAAGIRTITFPGLEGRLGGNDVIHVATLRGTAVGLVSATSSGADGNVQVRTFNLAGTPTNRGFSYMVYGTTTGPTP